MIRGLTLGSLFDGIGGWQLAAIHSGVTPIWSSEIEKFPLAVTKERFPDTLQLGDITKIDIDSIPCVDIVCAGSPCQDLSLANGERKGLDGERSGLFRKAVEIVHRMRDRTGGKYPKYFVWENVCGAFSSNGGNDFRTVIEEISKTTVPLPESGRWAYSGLVEWDGGSLAWRVLNAQYWGVPQRRRRVFLVASFGNRSAGEILFEPASLRRSSQESEEEREESPSGAIGSVEKTGGGNVPVIAFENRHDEGVRLMKDGKVNTLRASMGTGGGIVPCVFDNRSVRRLTPKECERLQGLPDDYTLIDDKSCCDSARYKALGNGMAQPCADFIIKRIGGCHD